MFSSIDIMFSEVKSEFLDEIDKIKFVILSRATFFLVNPYRRSIRSYLSIIVEPPKISVEFIRSPPLSQG